MLSCIFDFQKKNIHACITLGNERLGRTLLKLLVWSKARNSPAAVVPSFKVNVPLQAAAAGCWWRMVKVMIYICNPCLVLTVVSGPVKSVRNMLAYWQGYSRDHQTQNRDLLICHHQLTSCWKWQISCCQPAPTSIAHCSCAVVTSLVYWANKRLNR